MAVAVTIGSVPEQVGLSTKIALYRATQELLSNAFRHGNGAAVRLRLESDGQFLRLTVADEGPGFDVATLADEAGLGLAGMREQAELLGGDFEITVPARERHGDQRPVAVDPGPPRAGGASRWR